MKSSRRTERVSADSSAETVAERRAPGASSDSSPNASPGPSTSSRELSPSGVVTRTANRPLTIRCSVSAGSSRWKTTSPFENVLRRAIDSTSRTSWGGTSASSGHSTERVCSRSLTFATGRCLDFAAVPLYLTEDDVEAVLSIEDALEAVEDSFHRLAEGVVENRPRDRLRLDHGQLAVMAAS